MTVPVRVLIVDASSLIRRVLTRHLGQDPDIEVVGTAVDALDAGEKIRQLNPDVLTLDVEMPGMDGLTFLKKLMATEPMPVIMMSSLCGRNTQTLVDAMAAGAFHAVGKPGQATELNESIAELRRYVVAGGRSSIKSIGVPVKPKGQRPESEGGEGFIVVWSSTGGPAALMSFVESLPQRPPGVVIVQHIREGFTAALAKRLSQRSGLPCEEARAGSVVERGRIWIAPSTQHIRLVRSGSVFRLLLDSSAPVGGHRPSVDVLFHSAARAAPGIATGVILTGMGRDGAEGLLAMRRAGCRTFAQDEASCVVYGMPKVAVELGAVQRSMPVPQLAEIACLSLISV